MAGKTQVRGESVDLAPLSDDELLRMRFRDLGLKIEGTWLRPCVSRLYRELKSRGFVFKPECYLADEWLCPDGEPVIGIAFFLAHPRLKRLERKMMLEAEGGDRVSCMRLLRHETGHALNYAYYLHRRKRWRELFGPFSAEYPERYKYRPYSKSFVRHLDECYAQYHPDEDFAETFAVWLDPESDWQNVYRGWKALEKLEYVDRLMREIVPLPPKKADGEKLWDVTRMRSTLKTYYGKKRESQAESYPDFHDYRLQQIFPKTRRRKVTPADRLIRQHRKALLDYVSKCTGERKFIVGELLDDLVGRCRDLKLAVTGDETVAVMRVATYVTSLIMNYLYTGRFKAEKR